MFFLCYGFFFNLSISGLETEAREWQLHFHSPGLNRAAAWLPCAVPPNGSGSRAALFPTLLPEAFSFGHIFKPLYFLKKQLRVNSTLYLTLLTCCCKVPTTLFPFSFSLPSLTLSFAAAVGVVHILFTKHSAYFGVLGETSSCELFFDGETVVLLKGVMVRFQSPSHV